MVLVGSGVQEEHGVAKTAGTGFWAAALIGWD